MKHPAVILGLSPGGLAAVRSLGRAGISVHSVDSAPKHPAGSSRYGEFHCMPDPDAHPDELVAALLELEEQISGQPVLMPNSDPYVIFLSRNREALADRFVFRLPEAELLEQVVDKEGMAELCQQAGLPHPTTYRAQSVAEAEKFGDKIDFPVFVKPRLGHLWREQMGKTSKGVEVASKEELLQVLERVEEKELEVVIQSIVQGPDSNLRSTLILIGDDGETRALAQHRTVRQFPPNYGVGSCSESYVDPEAEAIAIHLLRSLEWEGPAAVQCKRDERGGPLVVLEVNPRWGQTVDLAIKAGMDLPLLEYRDSLGIAYEPVTEFEEGVRWIDLAADFLSARYYIKQGELRWLTWLRTSITAKAHAYFDIRDPMPFIRTYIRRMRSARKVSLHDATEPHKIENLK